MVSTDAAFEQILENIEPVLVQKGFSVVKAKSHPEAFGSRYVTFSDEKKFIRLIWDGKEYRFVLESVSIELAETFGGWTDILLQRFDFRNEGKEVVFKIANQIKDALSDY